MGKIVFWWKKRRTSLKKQKFEYCFWSFLKDLKLNNINVFNIMPYFYLKKNSRYLFESRIKNKQPSKLGPKNAFLTKDQKVWKKSILTLKIFFDSCSAHWSKKTILKLPFVFLEIVKGKNQTYFKSWVHYWRNQKTQEYLHFLVC